MEGIRQPQLDQLIERALRNSHDLAAATARVRQAQARAVIAGAPLLPELQFGLDASRQRLLRGDGNDQLDASSSERTSTSFGTRLSASYGSISGEACALHATAPCMAWTPVASTARRSS